MPEFNSSFCFFHELAFLLFHTLSLSNSFYFLPNFILMGGLCRALKRQHAVPRSQFTFTFCIEHNLSEPSTTFYLQFGLCQPRFLFVSSTAYQNRAQLLFAVWLVWSTTSFLFRTQLVGSGTIFYLQLACIEHNFFFESNTTYRNRARLLIFVASTLIKIEHNSLFPILLTPLFSGGTFPARCLKFMPPLSRPLQHGVKKIARLYHTFILDCQHSFHFSTTLLFALSRFGLHPTFNLCRAAFLFIPRTLLFRFF